MKQIFRWFFLIAVIAIPHSLTITSVRAVFFNPGSEPTPISEEAYWVLVQDSKDALSALIGRPSGEIKQELADIAAEWEVVTDIEINGQAVRVDNEYLIRLLRAEQPDLEKIDGLLSALLDAHKTYPKQVFSTAELVSLHTILSQPEFAWVEQAPNPLSEWFQKIWEAINRWLNKNFGDNGISIPVNTTLITVIASILLAAVLVFVFRTLFVDFIKESKINGEEDGESEPLTSDAAFERAQQLSRGGDYRSAVRYLYLSSLLLMDERGVLRYDRSKTNREYLRSVANSPELAQPLEEVIEVFDNVWYGYHSLEEDTFKHYSDRVEELKDKKS